MGLRGGGPPKKNNEGLSAAKVQPVALRRAGRRLRAAVSPPAPKPPAAVESGPPRRLRRGSLRSCPKLGCCKDPRAKSEVHSLGGVSGKHQISTKKLKSKDPLPNSSPENWGLGG